MRTTCSLFFALALAACAGDVRWDKPGIDEITLTGDLSACRKQAQAMYGGPAALSMSSPIDPRFGPTGPTPAASAMQESQAIGACMRGKGYILVPVGK